MKMMVKEVVKMQWIEREAEVFTVEIEHYELYKGTVKTVINNVFKVEKREASHEDEHDHIGICSMQNGEMKYKSFWADAVYSIKEIYKRED